MRKKLFKISYKNVNDLIDFNFKNINYNNSLIFEYLTLNIIYLKVINYKILLRFKDIRRKFYR